LFQYPTAFSFLPLDRLDYLKKTRTKASKEVKIGLKLVRGAYMEKENERLSKKDIQRPFVL